MRKLNALFLFVLFSLLIISCRENADLDAYDEGETDRFKDSYINYYLFDDSPQGYSDTNSIPTFTYGKRDVYDYLITTTKSKKKIMKESVHQGYSHSDADYNTIYYVINENNVDDFAEEYYQWYPEEEKDDLIKNAVQRLKDWFGTAATPPSNAFYERVFLFAQRAVFTKEPPNGENEYEIITQAQYFHFDEYENGKKLIIKEDGIKVFDFNVVINSSLGSTVKPLSQIDFQNTVLIAHQAVNVKLISGVDISN